MFCRVAESCVGGNDKTDHRYPAHLPTELNRQNNLAQNHPIHPITCIGHLRFLIVIEFNFVKGEKMENVRYVIILILMSLLSRIDPRSF